MTEMISNGSSKIYFIGIDKIINNELNEIFKVEDLDELRNGIEMYSLKQPISVIRSEDKFKIISGHRRIAAIRQIFAANKTIMFGSRELNNQVPCIFENEFVAAREQIAEYWLRMYKEEHGYIGYDTEDEIKKNVEYVELKYAFNMDVRRNGKDGYWEVSFQTNFPIETIPKNMRFRKGDKNGAKNKEI